MNLLVSIMQWFHWLLALPATWWVYGNAWCARQWNRLRR